MSRAIGAALLGVLLLLAAATFDSVSLYVPGVGLLLLGAGINPVRMAIRIA